MTVLARAGEHARFRLALVVRASMRRLVPFVSAHPGLVKLAGRLFTAFPALKPGLRRLVSRAGSVAPGARSLDDAQLRVLLDIQDAIEDARRPAP